jgi:hypothetical protein
MPRVPRLLHGLALAAAALLAQPAAPARAEAALEGSFDITFRGILAGQATWRARETERAYAVAGLVRSTGLVRLVADIRIHAEVTGLRSGSRFMPRRYREEVNNGQHRQTMLLGFRRGGVPVVETVEPPRPPAPEDLDPAGERGVVDPLTALFKVLRDVPAARACTARAVVFDGRRRSEVVLSSPVRDGERISCTGEYRRLAGFPDNLMQERRSFPFRLSYAPNGAGGLRVVEVAINTSHGPVMLVRR